MTHPNPLSSTLLRRLAALLAAIALIPGLTRAADVDYAYDEAGRLTGVIAPNGDSAQYVYDPAGNITEIKRFNVGQLAIIEFLPKSGPVGSTVTIWGSGFSTTPGSNAVSFNVTAATVSSATANKLVVSVPSGATTGTIAVTVSGTTVTSTKSFTVTPAVTCASRITGFTPSIGVAGASVALSGSSFDAGTNTVLFNGRAAATSGATSSGLTATVPAGATSGRISVSTAPLCGPVNIGDFFVPPPPATASDIAVTGRLTINGSPTTATLAAGKKALYVFDGTNRDGAGVYITGSTVGSVTVDIRSPDGTVLATSTFSTSTGQVGPAYLPMNGGYTVYVNPAGGAGNITLQLGAPDLAVSNPSVGTITGNQNGSFNVPASFTVTNLGTAAANPNWSDYGYISPSSIFGTSAVAVGSTVRSTALNPGANYSVSQTYSVTGVSPGNHVLFLRADSQGGGTADPHGIIVESNESNNAVGVSITLPTLPDLAVTSPTVGTITVAQNGTFSIPVTFTVSNLGTNPALASWNDYGYLSSTGVLDAASTVLSFSARTTNLAGGASYNLSPTYTTTAAPGTYTLFLKADGQSSPNQASNGVVAESNNANNAAGVTIVLPQYPDLVISNPSVGTITVNQAGTFNVPVSFTVTNSGGSPSQPNWFDHAYLSSNGVLDGSSVSIGSNTRATALAVSGSYNVSQTHVTSGINPGNYTLFLKTDGKANATQAGWVTEGNETNNLATGIAVTLPPYPDLVISSPSVGTITKNANNTWNIPVTFTVTNSGGSAAQPNWFDYAYLSTDGTLDAGDSQIGNCFRGTALAASANYSITCTYVTAAVSPGSYTVFVKTDGKSGPLQAGWVTEGNETNNVTAGLPVTLN